MTSILPLRLKGAGVTKRGKRLIGPIDHEIPAEGVTVVLGPNGAGKTTFLKMIHGLEKLSEGSAEWNVSDSEARCRQAFIFQHPILMRRTVLDNIAYPLLLNGVRRAEARSRAQEWAAKTGIGDKVDRQAGYLSGGERQKLALARALITGPELLLLDEPTSNLDGRATREFETVLGSVIASGTRIIMATHDLGQARRLGGQVVFIFHGHVHEAGPSEAFFENPRTPEGRAFVSGDIVE